MEGEKDKRGIKDEIAKAVVNEIKEEQAKKLKHKDKKFMKIKLSRGQLKRSYVYTILLRRNGQIDTKKLEIQDGAVFLPDNKTFHQAEGTHIWNYKRIPVIIQPEWSVNPIYRDKLASETKSEGTNVDAQRFIIKKAEEVAIGMKPSRGRMSPAIWGIIAGAIVLIYIISMIAGKPLF